MHSALLDHFQNPRNVGELGPPATVVEVTNPICGDILRLSVLMEHNTIRKVAYQVRGCAASIAAGSALTELLVGRNLSEVKAIKSSQIDNAVGGLPNESKHAAALCLDAVKALLKQHS